MNECQSSRLRKSDLKNHAQMNKTLLSIYPNQTLVVYVIKTTSIRLVTPENLQKPLKVTQGLSFKRTNLMKEKRGQK